jgi:hypothetical protein
MRLHGSGSSCSSPRFLRRSNIMRARTSLLAEDAPRELQMPFPRGIRIKLPCAFLCPIMPGADRNCGKQEHQESPHDPGATGGRVRLEAKPFHIGAVGKHQAPRSEIGNLKIVLHSPTLHRLVMSTPPPPVLWCWSSSSCDVM